MGRSLLAMIFSMAVIVTPAVLAATDSQTQVTGAAESQTSLAPFRIAAFPDRLAVKKGEAVNVRVWVESKLMESAIVAVFFAADQLALGGTHSRQVSLPTDSPTTFTFVAENTGKSNIFVRVIGLNNATKETLSVHRQIEGIEVQAGAQWWSSLFSGPLSGVVIGALLTLGMTLLNERRQRQREATQRQRWLTEDLPAHLAADQVAVLNEQKAEFERWTGKLLTEGYYTELRKQTEQDPDLKPLAQKLMEATFHLRDYEGRRLDKRLTNECKERVAAQLAEIIEQLRKL